MLLTHRQPVLWNQRYVSSSVNLEVDWTHPLASGLVACYVPGSVAGLADLADLSGFGPSLEPDSGGAFYATPEGVGYDARVLNGSAWTATTPVEWTCQAGGTMYWRGLVAAAPTYGTGFQPQVFGMSYGGSPDGTAAPVYGLSLAVFNAFTGQHPAFMYFPKAGGGQQSVQLVADWTSIMVGNQPVAFGATFIPGGAVKLYVWPLSGTAPSITAATWTGSANPIDSTQGWLMALGVTPTLDSVDSNGTVTTSAYMWNRVLSPAEMGAINAAPLSMLRPFAQPRRVGPPVILSLPYRRWNRTYLIR